MARINNGTQVHNDDKTKQLILYLAKVSEDDTTFGSVKLNKLLFYADFLAYVRLGKSITGQEYQALQHGPAPRRLVPIREAMVAEQSLAMVQQDFHNHVQHKPIARREADLSEFTADEIALVDYVVSSLRNATAKQVSEGSHQFIGWQYAKPNETIPYSVALVSNRAPTLSERIAGLKLESRAQEYVANAGY
jgi:uncharacterized phage-associated protein